MKTAIIVAGLLLAHFSHAGIVQCAGKYKGKTETFKARYNSNNKIVWFSKAQLVSANRDSFFSWLSDMNHFGLEGSGSFTGKSGYSMVSVTNTAESVTIGLSPDLSLGFFSYQDGGSGLGSFGIPMSCRVIPQAPAI